MPGGVRSGENTQFVGAGIEQGVYAAILASGFARALPWTGQHIHQLQRGASGAVRDQREAARRLHAQQRGAFLVRG